MGSAIALNGMADKGATVSALPGRFGEVSAADGAARADAAAAGGAAVMGAASEGGRGGAASSADSADSQRDAGAPRSTEAGEVGDKIAALGAAFPGGSKVPAAFRTTVTTWPEPSAGVVAPMAPKVDSRTLPPLLKGNLVPGDAGTTGAGATAKVTPATAVGAEPGDAVCALGFPELLVRVAGSAAERMAAPGFERYPPAVTSVTEAPGRLGGVERRGDATGTAGSDSIPGGGGGRGTMPQRGEGMKQPFGFEERHS